MKFLKPKLLKLKNKNKKLRPAKYKYLKREASKYSVARKMFNSIVH